jgi:hypothetical protein
MSVVLGLDVSKWQPTTPSLQGMGFLFARATVGTQVDNMYDTHISNARRANLIVGAYHFAYKGSIISIAAQVKAFLAAAGDVDFYFIDVEGVNAPSHSEVHDFLHAMHVAGKKCGLYHSASGYFDAGQDYNWVAKWGSTPPAGAWQFWQYQGSPLDRDQFNGSHDDLVRFAGYPTTPTAPPTDTIGDSMKLTSLTPLTGRVKMDADGPVWEVADGSQHNVQGGSEWEAIATCMYDSPGAAGTTTGPGYVFIANSNEHSPFVVSKARSTFTPAKPVVVDDGYTKATQDAAVAAQKQADQAAITAANAAAAKAQADLATAAGTERERLAQSLGKAEADKVRNS